MDKNQVAIIGAGPCGLSMARMLKALNIPFTVYEKHSDVGGIWDRSNEGSPIYRTAHFISSRTESGFTEFPMPDHFPEYPSHVHVLEYLRSFAKTHGLKSHIRFNTKVEKISFEDELWHIQSGDGTQVSYRWLVCASGTTWHPNRPILKGEERFEGEIIHSNIYDDDNYLRGKRVLVVGAGNSGVDIACDAAHNADSAHLSLRRGYHFVPKYLFGMPADVFAKKVGSGPMWLEQKMFSWVLRLLNGNMTRLGLQKPDHLPMSSHPIVNSQVLHYLQHGDLKAHQDIDFLSGSTVNFVDGSSIEVDLVILATGYNWHIPYLPKEVYEWKNGRPKIYLRIFNPKYASLFALGYCETNAGGYHLFDKMAYLTAKTIESQLHHPKVASQINEHINGLEPDLSGKITFVESSRHTNYVDSTTWVRELEKFRKKFGWKDLKSLLQNPVVASESIKFSHTT